MKKILLYSLILIAFTPLMSVAATDTYTLLEPLPSLDGSGGTTATMDLNGYIGYIFKFAIALAAFLAVIMIIKGGFEYIISETPFGKSNGRETITNALVGLLMVLASYLILQTIDPRLVEINTSITPIKIDTKSVENFQNKLQEDLSKMSAENQLTVNNLVATNKENQKQIDYLTSKGEEITPEENVTLQKLKGEIASAKVQINSLVTETIGLTQFNGVINTLRDKNNYTEPLNISQNSTDRNFIIKNSELSGDLQNNVKTAQETIATRYNEYIASLGNTDAATKQLFEKQRDFYISEVDREAQVNQLVISYNNTDTFLNGNDSAYKKIATKDLNTLLDIYKKDYANPQKGTSAGLENQYKTMLSQRINLINDTLSTKK